MFAFSTRIDFLYTKRIVMWVIIITLWDQGTNGGRVMLALKSAVGPNREGRVRVAARKAEKGEFGVENRGQRG